MFTVAAPQIRGIMHSAGLLTDRTIEDIQIVAMLSTIASTMKAVVLHNDAALRSPVFRGRLVQMGLVVLSDGPVQTVPIDPVEWTYDGVM